MAVQRVNRNVGHLVNVLTETSDEEPGGNTLNGGEVVTAAAQQWVDTQVHDRDGNDDHNGIQVSASD